MARLPGSYAADTALYEGEGQHRAGNLTRPATAGCADGCTRPQPGPGCARPLAEPAAVVEGWGAAEAGAAALGEEGREALGAAGSAVVSVAEVAGASVAARAADGAGGVAAVREGVGAAADGADWAAAEAAGTEAWAEAGSGKSPGSGLDQWLVPRRMAAGMSRT